MTYEKEIYSLVIPLSKREIMVVIRDFCHIPFGEFQGDIPTYVLSNMGNKIMIFYISDRSEIQPLDLEFDTSKKPAGERKGPDYLGYVETKEMMEHIEIPIQIRIVSYHAEVDLWWGRLAEKIIWKSHKVMSSFAPELDSNIPSISSEVTQDLFSEGRPETHSEKVTVSGETSSPSATKQLNRESKEYPIIDASSEIDRLRAKLPKNKASLSKWIFIANKINRKSFQGGLTLIGKHIKERYPRYPHSREVLGIIFRAKDAGLLNPPDSENLS